MGSRDAQGTRHVFASRSQSVNNTYMHFFSGARVIVLTQPNNVSTILPLIYSPIVAIMILFYLSTVSGIYLCHSLRFRIDTGEMAMWIRMWCWEVQFRVELIKQLETKNGNTNCSRATCICIFGRKIRKFTNSSFNMWSTVRLLRHPTHSNETTTEKKKPSIDCLLWYIYSANGCFSLQLLKR